MNTPISEAQPLLIMEGESGSASRHGVVEFCFGSWSLHTHENPSRLSLCVMSEHSLQRGIEHIPWQAVTWTLKRRSDVFYVLGDTDDRLSGSPLQHHAPVPSGEHPNMAPKPPSYFTHKGARILMR